MDILKKMVLFQDAKNRKWFKERYIVIEEKGVETIESYNELLYEYEVENKAFMHEASKVG